MVLDLDHAAPLSADPSLWSEVQAAVYDWDAPQSFGEPVDVPRQHQQGRNGTGDLRTPPCMSHPT